MLTIHLSRADGRPEPHTVLYDPENMRMTWDDGGALPVEELYNSMRGGRDVKRANPTVRIILGRACNFRCQYCHQSFGEYDDYAGRPCREKLDELVEHLAAYAADKPGIGFHFWGGEPFLYFEEMKYLLTRLSDRVPGCEFALITNGSLFTEENVNFLLEAQKKNTICLCISHDGSGQPFRTRNPLDDPESFALIRRLKEGLSYFSFNPVITRLNADIKSIDEYFASRFGEENLCFGEGAPITVCCGVGGECVIPREQLRQHAQDMYRYLLETPPDKMRFSLWILKMREFLQHLAESRPVPPGGCCVACAENSISVDLLGNVLTCQTQYPRDVNRLGESHCWGHISQDPATWKRASPWGWDRRDCGNCPVLMFCRGACPHSISDVDEEETCHQYFYHYFPILSFVVSQLTGRLVTGVTGDFRRAADFTA